MDGWDHVLRTRTELSADRRDRLSALVREWSLLADLSFSDLVLFVRTWDGAGWYVAGHVRPSTAATVFTDDLTRSFLPRSHATVLERALLSGDTVRGGVAGSGARLGGRGFPEPIEAIPVSYDGDVVAVVARYSLIDQRRLGELERHYLAVADLLFTMVAAGKFPTTVDSVLAGTSPRVGDGLIRLDAGGAVIYASPNARSCLRRYGVADPIVGRRLVDELAGAAKLHAPIDAADVRVAEGTVAGEVEFSSAAATVTVRAIPLSASGGSDGAAVLIRDVSDIRRQERALLSKEATIREIHHRVKNNLQTVGALLRLQARRVPSPEGRAALLDAVARVGTIALVHDSLARSPGDDVAFDEIFRRILAIARDAAAAQDTPPRVQVTGSFGTLPAVVATPLAMVLAELLLNAIEHSGATRVAVAAERSDQLLRLTVADDGVGFDPTTAEGLGLQIVATLVAEQLHGQLVIRSQDHAPWPTGAVSDDAGSLLAHRVLERAATTVVVSCPV